MISTPDICDRYEERIEQGSVRILDPIFHAFGGVEKFFGEVVTIKCFEDNSFVKSQAAEAGNGKVLVVDGGGSLRKALLGDMIASTAIENGWSGMIFNGVIRDVDVLDTLKIGVRALGAIPVKTDKRGVGDINVSVHFAGQWINPGNWIYVDRNGIIVSEEALDID